MWKKLSKLSLFFLILLGGGAFSLGYGCYLSNIKFQVEPAAGLTRGFHLEEPLLLNQNCSWNFSGIAVSSGRLADHLSMRFRLNSNEEVRVIMWFELLDPVYQTHFTSESSTPISGSPKPETWIYDPKEIFYQRAKVDHVDDTITAPIPLPLGLFTWTLNIWFVNPLETPATIQNFDVEYYAYVKPHKSSAVSFQTIGGVMIVASFTPILLYLKERKNQFHARDRQPLETD